ncbi:VOC family protein [Brevundimonas diminuta]|uniref:VOC family protein n=1 Tax=Brevundimonas diminuta TaxID=293 RepID=UPI003D9AB09A
MSRLFGPITQNGYVVEDVEAAARFWAETLGVGPFFMLPSIRFERYSYRGQMADPELRIALANSGDLQIELIEQVNDAPSAYKDFLEGNGPGLQHLSVWSESYAADTARYADRGLEPLAEGVLPGGIGFIYYDTGFHGGSIMEVLDLRPDVKARMAAIREAAKAWDGSDPLRWPA